MRATRSCRGRCPRSGRVDPCRMRGDHSDRLVQARRHEHRTDVASRRCSGSEPASSRCRRPFGSPAPRTSASCNVDEDVGARGLQLDDLRVDGRIAHLVAGLGDDHRGRLVAEPVFQSLQVVLAVVVVLVQNGDLRVRVWSAECAWRRSALRSGSWAAKPIVHGWFCGSFHFAAPLARNSCGTLRAFR